MKDRICLYTPPTNKIKSYYDYIDFAYQHGFKYLETINDFGLPTPTLTEAENIRKYADKNGVSFVCVSVGIDLVCDNRKKNIDTLKQYVQIASILGSKYLHHTIAPNINDPKYIQDNHSLFWNRGIASVREVFDYAERLGIRTLYEDQGFLFNGVNNFKRFLSEVERNVGIVADFGNIMFVEEEIVDFIELCGARIVNVHLKDYTMTNEKICDTNTYRTKNGKYLTECPLEKGNVNFELAFQKLSEIGYKGTFSLETVPLGDNPLEIFNQNIEIMEKYIDRL